MASRFLSAGIAIAFYDIVLATKKLVMELALSDGSAY
jgi:hypothetical protein